MARLASAADLARRAAARQAREAEIQRRRAAARPAGQTVQSRGPSTQLFYRSLLRKLDATTHLAYACEVRNDALQGVGGFAAVGLLETIGTDMNMGSMRKEILPSRAFWYEGDATPVTQRSAWGTSWSRYYGTGTHRSCPISKGSGAFDSRDIRTTFTGLFGPGGSARSQMGTQNGRAYLRLETEKEKPYFES